MNRSSSSMKKTRMQALSVIMPHTFHDSKDSTTISAKPDEYLNSSHIPHDSKDSTRMQALFVILPYTFPDSMDFTPISTKCDEDLNSNIKLDHEEKNFEGQEFSFACANPQGILIFADDIFDNGQIRPIFPIYDQSVLFIDTQNKENLSLRPPLKKLFVEQQKCISSKLDCKPEEPFNKWSKERTFSKVQTSNEKCKESSSAGFSKLLRIRQGLKPRSNCEGHDTFVLLNPSSPTPPKRVRLNNVNGKNVTKNKTKEREHKMTFSAYEKHYGMRRMRKESDKQRSFLPYKQVFIGFFVNANRFSRNLHPF